MNENKKHYDVISEKAEKLMEFLEYYRERLASGKRDHVKISSENNKMGPVPSVSLVPIATCPADAFNPLHGCAVDKNGKVTCYAARMGLFREMIRKSYCKNTVLWYDKPEQYEQDIRKYLDTHKPAFFRWHVAGDIPATRTQDYINLVFTLAHNYPDTEFLIFTRRHVALNEYVRKNIDPLESPRAYTDEYPDNLHILFSAWDKPLSEKAEHYLHTNQENWTLE